MALVAVLVLAFAFAVIFTVWVVAGGAAVRP